MKQETIDISKMDKATVLAALYNASKPQGMGFMQFDPKPMTRDEAAELLKESDYFDYLKGRVMKIQIADALDPWGYDRDNGAGAVSRVIAVLQSTADANAPELNQKHKDGTRREAARVLTRLGEESKMETHDGVATMKLGLSDVAGQLAPKVNEAIENL